MTPFRYGLLLLFCFVLSCERSESPKTAPADTTKTSLPVAAMSERLTLTVARPWSVSVLAATAKQPGLIAAVSHSEGLLVLWSVAADRRKQVLGKGDVGFHPDDVRWVDWDGDGQITELLVAAEGSKEIHLWQWTDNQLGKLAATAVVDSPQTVQATDLDDDGEKDIVFGPYKGHRVTVLLNEGDFVFTPLYLDAMPDPVYPKLADWDSDGVTDIVWSDWQTGSLRWAKNQGQRRFVINVLREPGPGTPREVELGDINGDAIADMVVPLETGKSAWIMLNDGQGGVADVRKLSSPGAGYSTAAISSQELGLLALGNVVKIILAKNSNDKGWQLRELGDANLPQAMQFVDVDGDGLEDLIYANSAGDDVVVVFGPVWEQGQELDSLEASQ